MNKVNETKKKKSLYTFKPFDLLFLFFTTVFVLSSMLIVSFVQPPAGNMWEIRYDFKVIMTGDLHTQEEIVLSQEDYPDLLGEMIIEVDNGKIRIKEETSPNNVCSKQGWTDNTYKVLICEPNNIIVSVINDSGDFEIPDDIPPGGIG